MSRGRTCKGMTRRILGANLEVGVDVFSVALEVEVEAVILVFTFDQPGPDAERNFGAMLTSVLVVNKRASPFDCGSRETDNWSGLDLEDE